MRIIPVTADQANEIIAIQKEAKREGLSLWSLQSVESFLIGSSEKSGYQIRKDGQMVGVVLFQLVDDDLEIMSLVIHPQQQRRGLGSQLLKHLVETYVGCRMILEVSVSNEPALCLYQKMGFEKKGRRPNYYSNGDTKLDAWVMIRERKVDQINSPSIKNEFK